jgi:hypothetical protein
MSSFESSDAWMFLSVAYSAQNGLGSLDAFYGAADHINCAIPTREEIEGGINRLASVGLVRVEDGAFALTDAGRQLFERVCQQTPYPRSQPGVVEEHLRTLRPADRGSGYWTLSPEDSEAGLSVYRKRAGEALRKIRHGRTL